MGRKHNSQSEIAPSVNNHVNRMSRRDYRILAARLLHRWIPFMFPSDDAVLLEIYEDHNDCVLREIKHVTSSPGCHRMGSKHDYKSEIAPSVNNHVY